MPAKNIFYSFLSILILLYFSGCTVMGLLVGSMIDKDNALVRHSKIEEIEKVEIDTLIEINLRDDQVIEGRFWGLEKIDSSEYIQRYNYFLAGQQNKTWFPAINDTIFLYDQYGHLIKKDDRKFIFSGFDFNSISLRSATGSDMMSMKLKEFELIVSKKRNIIKVHEIKDYLEKGILPLQSELVNKTYSGVQKFPMENILMENILMIELPKPKTNNWRNGLGALGFITDVVCIVITAEELSKPMLDFSNSEINWSY